VPRFKVCGLTRFEDAELATELGAWALGTILWPGSERACDPAEAARIAAAMRRRAEVVGVFVNQPLEEVCGMVEGLNLTMAQLHGDEGPSFCGEVARRTGAKVIKAARVRSGEDIQHLEAFHTDFHLLDAYKAGRWGGTGDVFDWDLVRARRSNVPLILSGGLTPENVRDAVAAVHPFAVDVASGTESAPGVKDPEKLRAFAEAVHEATRAEATA
jgi:phosphoribosylanthranilate isomerase